MKYRINEKSYSGLTNRSQRQPYTKSATIFFIGGILLAGIANVMGKLFTNWYLEDPSTSLVLPFFSTLMFCLNLMIYVALLLSWAQALMRRLLPSRERSYLFLASMCMVAMLILRSVKYRMIDEGNVTLLRYVWYLYYLPMILLPTFFLMICICIETKNRNRRFDERWLLLPATVLIFLFLTNDLHHLAFIPIAGKPFNGASKYYTNNILLYVYYGYYVVAVGTGLFLLSKANSRFRSFKKAVAPFLFLPVMLGLTMLDKMLNLISFPSMFLVPETVSFGMIGVFESCIRSRLIPHNENYVGFFEHLRLPVIITHKDFSVTYHTAEPIEAGREELEKSLLEPIYLEENRKLSGNELKAGYTFYTEDESELIRLNENIAEANELIESENELIRAENELKQRRALIDSRKQIYTRIDKLMYPYYLKTQALLDRADPDSPDFSDTVVQLNILHTYIKRGTNLLLSDRHGDDIDSAELRLSLEETARYLYYAGIEAQVNPIPDTLIGQEKAIALYTAFEEVAEALTDWITMLSITLEDETVRMVADCEKVPEIPLTEFPVTIKQSDGLCYITIGDEKEAAR